MTDKEFTNSLVKQVVELEANVKWLKKKLNHNMIDSVANFGAWLVNTHECRFSGGEIEIAELCSEYVEYVESESKPKE